MKLLKRSLAMATASAALLAFASDAIAGGFAVREQSAQAQGLSFAGAASGSGGLGSMFWNPATITMNPGWQSQYSLSALWIQSDLTPQLGTSPLLLPLGPAGDISQDAIVAAGASSIQISDNVWIGNTSGAPYGLVTKPRNIWAGQVYSRSSKIFTFDVNPILGIKLNEWLSIAGGPELQYFSTRLKRATGVAVTSPNAILDGESIGLGFTAGVTITPWTGTVIGVGYRSSMHHELDGKIYPAVGTYIPIQAKLNLPETVTVGLTQSIWPNFRVNFGFEWANWSRLGTVGVVAQPNAIQLAPVGRIVTTIPLNYEDGYFYSAGLEYDWGPQLTLRGGVAYEESPIDTRIRSTRLPDNDRIWASLGATYRWSHKLSFDVAYTHIFVKETPIRIVPGHQDFIPTPAALGGLPFVGDADGRVDIFSVGLKYRWDDPKVAIPAPIVRKG
jgi:long-chain fatty acid transport protein